MGFFQRYSWISWTSAIFLQCQKQRAVGELKLQVFYEIKDQFICGSVCSQATGRLCGLTFIFLLLRSFDTESEESRWVTLFPVSANISEIFVWNSTSDPLSHYLLCTWTSACTSVTPPTFLHPVNLYAACSRPQIFLLLLFLGLFSVNFHISQSCCFWETPTCCHLHTVSSG